MESHNLRSSGGRADVIHLNRFVKTDMGNNGAVAFGMKEAITSVEDSVKYLVATVCFLFKRVLRPSILIVPSFRLTSPRGRRHLGIFQLSKAGTFHGRDYHILNAGQVHQKPKEIRSAIDTIDQTANCYNDTASHLDANHSCSFNVRMMLRCRIFECDMLKN